MTEPAVVAESAADPPSNAAERFGHPTQRAYAGWKRIPPLVRAATLGFGGLMLALMYLYPANYGFDEPQHFDMAYAYAQSHGPYAPGHRDLSAGVHQESLILARGYPPNRQLADVAVTARSARKSIAGYGGDAPTVGVVNQMVQHPPLYYELGAGILAIPGVSSLHADQQFTLLRYLSLLLMLPIPWLCYATAKRVGAGTLAPSASLVPLLFPSLGRMGASVTNDSLMVLSGCAVLYLVVKVCTGDTSTRTALWMGAWILIGLLTKGFALILPLLGVLAYVVCWRRTGTKAIRQALVVCGFSAVGGIWWAHNLIAYGSVQPDGAPGYTDAIYARIHPGPERGHLSTFLDQFFHHLVGRFWGSIGLIEAPDYNWTLTWIAMVVLVVLTVVALVRGIGGRAGRAAIVVPLLMVPFTIVLLLQGSWPTYHRYVLLAGVQGRYIYPAIGVIAAVALLGANQLLPVRAKIAVPAFLFAVAAYAEAWTARAVVHAWWITHKPVSTLSAWKNAVHAITNWAPWPIGVTIGIGVLIAAAELWLLLTVIRTTLSRDAVGRA